MKKLIAFIVVGILVFSGCVSKEIKTSNKDKSSIDFVNNPVIFPIFWETENHYFIDGKEYRKAEVLAFDLYIFDIIPKPNSQSEIRIVSYEIIFNNNMTDFYTIYDRTPIFNGKLKDSLKLYRKLVEMKY